MANNAEKSLAIQQKNYYIHAINSIKNINLHQIPYSIKVLLENMLRKQQDNQISQQDIELLANWQPTQHPNKEISFSPSRVLLQDFTGVPAVVDLAAMRDAMQNLGDVTKINPQIPVELVIDHSIMVDIAKDKAALEQNYALEFARNQERYSFLRWGQKAFSNFKVVPPNTGIVHQVNLEHLARVVFQDNEHLYPDTVVGTDSHTPMINALGVLGWGVGGIEAEAAMLGQAIPMLIPKVVGFKLTGKLSQGITATDLVLTIVELLRKHGVVGKFVEFYGNGLDNLPVTDRATIANMAPEYGATCGIFPIDKQTLNYLQLTGKTDEQLAIIEQYAKAQDMFREKDSAEALYNEYLELDLSTIQACIAGPSRPQDRILLSDVSNTVENLLSKQISKQISITTEKSKPSSNTNADNYSSSAELSDEYSTLQNGDIVIAAITSCTNTSNPDVMLAAGLLAKKACELGVTSKPWVKTSLAPGSKVVTEYLKKSGLLPYMEEIGFNLVGYGCTTCIGNSGPLPSAMDEVINQKNLSVASVLSGNRNFEGRIHPNVKLSFLASPPLVIAYAIAGSVLVDIHSKPLAKDKDGKDVYLSSVWPSNEEIAEAKHSISSNMFKECYSSVFTGDERWRSISTTDSKEYQWQPNSTYVQCPPYFTDMPKEKPAIKNIKHARVLCLFGDSITTDHISPAGSIAANSPAAQYLISQGVAKKDFNSYGSRRGNHEVMMRGTFANVRLKNHLALGTEGGFTTYLPENKIMDIYTAAAKYRASNTPLIVLAGKEYGSGSSRDWAAKGPKLLGVQVVIAESMERIHRSNLIGMGVMPLQFINTNYTQLGLDGTETFDIDLANIQPAAEVIVTATKADGTKLEFKTITRIDTPRELEYFQHGGILQFMLRQLAK